MDEFIKYAGYAIALLTGGVMYFFPARRKEIDNATKTLVETLQETVKALKDDLDVYKGKVEKLETHQKENIKEIETIKTENTTMRTILQGRDEDTQKFQEQGFKSMNLIIETHQAVAKLIGAVGDLTKGIEKNNEMTKDFVEMMKKHFLNVEQAAIKTN